MRLVTTQVHIDDRIVQRKISERDFCVQVSPEFLIEGEPVRHVIDGHHSLQAALELGVDPILEEYDSSDYDALYLLERGDVDGYLDVFWYKALYYADTYEMVF